MIFIYFFINVNLIISINFIGLEISFKMTCFQAFYNANPVKLMHLSTYIMTSIQVCLQIIKNVKLQSLTFWCSKCI